MNDILNFIIIGISWRGEELKAKGFKMEILMGLQILEGSKKYKYIYTYNEAMQDLEDHFRLSYREFDEVVPLIAEAAVEIVNSKQRKHPKETNK